MRYLDYFFYRLFEILRSQKYDVEKAREKCCDNMVKMLHVIILPIAFNVSMICHSKKSWVGIIVYIVLLLMTYKFVHNRYSKQQYRSLLKKYAYSNAKQLPTLILGLLYILSFIVAIALSAGIYHLVVKPLGLDGYFVILYR